MIYQAAITVDADTPETSAKRHILHVTKGLIYRVEVVFPPGPSGLLKMRVMDGGHQIWPSTPGEYFAGNDIVINYEDLYIKDKEPWCFIVLAHNLDELYEHTVTLRLGIASEKAFMAHFLPHITQESYQEWLQNIRDIQEAERQAIIENPFPARI